MNPPDEAIGRSKGGFSSKLHLCCDGKGKPLSVVFTGGQRHESTQLGTVLDEIEVPWVGRGRSRKKPDHLIADKGYSYPGCRDLLRKRGIAHTIPERRDQRRGRARRPGRKPGFEKATYRRRNVVERCVNRLKQWRRIATRYDKRGRELPACGCNRCADDLVGFINSQTDPSYIRKLYYSTGGCASVRFR